MSQVQSGELLTEVPNWPKFYEVMMQVGATSLSGIPSDWVKWLQNEGSCSDLLWCEEFGNTFEALWSQSPEDAVRGELDNYLSAVKRALLEFPFCDGAGWRREELSGRSLDWCECVMRIEILTSPADVALLIGSALQH